MDSLSLPLPPLLCFQDPRRLHIQNRTHFKSDSWRFIQREAKWRCIRCISIPFQLEKFDGSSRVRVGHLGINKWSRTRWGLKIWSWDVIQSTWLSKLEMLEVGTKWSRWQELCDRDRPWQAISLSPSNSPWHFTSSPSRKLTIEHV